MRLSILFAPIFAFAVCAHAQDTGLQNDTQKTLYALGLALGQNIEPLGVEASEVKFISMGIKDALTGAKPKVDFSVYSAKIKTLPNERREAITARLAAHAAKEKTAAKPFLDKMAAEKGAVVTKSGLIYFDIKKGTGASPKAIDRVRVHYTGTLRDGTVFDSSVQRGTPAEFPLNQVVPCWTEGLQKMKVGGKAKLVCPSNLAYGDRGSPPQIAGGAPLVFEVELLDILK